MAIKNLIYLFLLLQISFKIVFTFEVRNFRFNGVQVPVHIFIIPYAMWIHIPPSPIWSRPDSLAIICKIIVIFIRICVFINNSSKSVLTFCTTLWTVFPRRSAPLFYCLIEFTSSFRSLYVLDKSSSCWPMAYDWKVPSVFCVADSLFSDIL